MKYFAYGSNMSLKRLQARVPSAERIGLYKLLEHKLKFHKQSQDGSSKCDAFFSNNSKDIIYGSLFEIAPSEKHYLDEVEGVGKGYDIKEVVVYGNNGKAVPAYTYVATDIIDNMQPYSWYLNHVIVGAKEVGVPTPYLNNIVKVQSKKDTDVKRNALNQALYK